MNRIARFEKVSERQFAENWSDILGLYEGAKEAYSSITLPVRATAGSAGYDFVLPCELTLEPGSTAVIPTGIRVKIDSGWALMIYPRSGLGFRYRLRLDNTVGVIDSDYYYSSNEGHILIKLTNESTDRKVLRLNAGDRFAQGIFTPYGITVDDSAEGIRDGGFGSTDIR